MSQIEVTCYKKGILSTIFGYIRYWRFQIQ